MDDELYAIKLQAVELLEQFYKTENEHEKIKIAQQIQSLKIKYQTLKRRKFERDLKMLDAKVKLIKQIHKYEKLYVKMFGL